MKRAGLLLGLCLCAGTLFSGRAQGTGGPPRLILKALDTDEDGTLSAAEISAAPQTLITLDRNSDGQLTIDELLPRPENVGATPDELVTQLMMFDRNGDGVLTMDELPVRMQPLFLRGDTNHDGKLTPEEIRAMAGRQGMPVGTNGSKPNPQMRNDPLLNALDADHDGVISAAEIANAKQSLLALDKNGDGRLTPDEMRVRQQTPQERVDHLLEEWDTNKDGKISKAEAPDRMQQQFSAIDTNGDGYLDRDELLAYFSTQGSGERGDRRQSGTQNPQGPPSRPEEQKQ